VQITQLNSFEEQSTNKWRFFKTNW